MFSDADNPKTEILETLSALKKLLSETEMLSGLSNLINQHLKLFHKIKAVRIFIVEIFVSKEGN